MKIIGGVLKFNELTESNRIYHLADCIIPESVPVYNSQEDAGDRKKPVGKATLKKSEVGVTAFIEIQDPEMQKAIEVSMRNFSVYSASLGVGKFAEDAVTVKDFTMNGLFLTHQQVQQGIEPVCETSDINAQSMCCPFCQEYACEC